MFSELRDKNTWSHEIKVYIMINVIQEQKGLVVCMYVCFSFFLLNVCYRHRFFTNEYAIFFSLNYTAVSVWENDCSGIVIRVLAPDPAAPVSEVTCTEA